MPTTNRMKIQFDASHLMMASSCRCFAVVDSIIGAGIGSAIRGGHGCACGQPASRPAGAPADAVRGYGLPAGDIVSWRGEGRRGAPQLLRMPRLAPAGLLEAWQCRVAATSTAEERRCQVKIGRAACRERVCRYV